MRSVLRPVLAAATVVVALAAVAGCGGHGSDDGALAGPVPAGQASAAPSYPPVPVTTAMDGDVEYPVVSKTPKAAQLNTDLRARAGTLTGRGVACSVQTLRADVRLLSFSWTCAGQGGTTATFDTAAGTRVDLGQLFTAGYLDRLSATAVTQLVAGGATGGSARRAAAPTAAAFAEWGVDDDDLDVTFDVSGHPTTVSFPLPSLEPITNQSGPLRTGR